MGVCALLHLPVPAVLNSNVLATPSVLNLVYHKDDTLRMAAWSWKEPRVFSVFLFKFIAIYSHCCCY